MKLNKLLLCSAAFISAVAMSGCTKSNFDVSFADAIIPNGIAYATNEGGIGTLVILNFSSKKTGYYQFSIEDLQCDGPDAKYSASYLTTGFSSGGAMYVIDSKNCSITPAVYNIEKGSSKSILYWFGALTLDTSSNIYYKDVLLKHDSVNHVFVEEAGPQ